MNASIFGKALDDVEYNDVVEFCKQQIKEGLYLDYKKDLSSPLKIVKTLVSYANTLGGWVIIGVEDDGHDKPKLPATGIEHSETMEQSVINAIVASVSPIFMPTFRVVKSDKSDKSFMIIYAPQSEAAPHWMEYKGEIVLFTRVSDRANRTDYEKYATEGEWELLRHRRESAERKRTDLVALMKDTFEAKADAIDEKEKEIAEEEKSANAGPFAALTSMNYTLPTNYFEGRHFRGCLTSLITPAYPSETLSTVGTVSRHITRNFLSCGSNRYRPTTPDVRGNDSSTYQHGAYLLYKDQSTHDNHYFFGADMYGNVMNVDPLEQVRRINDMDQYMVLLTSLIPLLEGNLSYAKTLYDDIGVLGRLQWRVDFDGQEGCWLLHNVHTGDWPFNEDNPPVNATGQVSISRSFDSIELSTVDGRTKLLMGVIPEFLRAFNYDYYDKTKLEALVRSASSLKS